jgi:hypothetical protein
MDASAAGRPVLHLSGPRLRHTLDGLLAASEAIGGIERFAAAVRIKAELFQEHLGAGRAASIERGALDDLVHFLPTVRRRIGPLLATDGWPRTRAAIAHLLADAHVPGTGDARIAAFESELRRRLAGMDPSGAAPRFLRDLAAELLHNVYPEHYPLMTRWVWDARTNTGVLREIWHDPTSGDDTDRIVIDVPDTHDAFLVLREELSQFLSDQGIFRDMIWYVDLLAAHIYGGYINSQGGAWLKADFATEGEPLEHTRRILGLDPRKRAPSSS